MLTVKYPPPPPGAVTFRMANLAGTDRPRPDDEYICYIYLDEPLCVLVAPGHVIAGLLAPHHPQERVRPQRLYPRPANQSMSEIVDSQSMIACGNSNRSIMVLNNQSIKEFNN
jgi:hypothetical protein